MPRLPSWAPENTPQPEPVDEMEEDLDKWTQTEIDTFKEIADADPLSAKLTLMELREENSAIDIVDALKRAYPVWTEEKLELLKSLSGDSDVSDKKLKKEIKKVQMILSQKEEALPPDPRLIAKAAEALGLTDDLGAMRQELPEGSPQRRPPIPTRRPPKKREAPRRAPPERPKKGPPKIGPPQRLPPKPPGKRRKKTKKPKRRRRRQSKIPSKRRTR